jgi:hypothetical protein
VPPWGFQKSATYGEPEFHAARSHSLIKRSTWRCRPPQGRQLLRELLGNNVLDQISTAGGATLATVRFAN